MDIFQLNEKLKLGKISNEKYELIKGMLIKEKSKIKPKDDKLLLEEMQKVIPEVNTELLDKVQQDPSYIKELIRKNIASLTPKLTAILAKLEEKCLDGDIRAIQLFVKLIGLDKDSVGILKSDNNETKVEQEQNLKSLSDDELNSKFFNVETYLK